jgi:hypothetical protein
MNSFADRYIEKWDKIIFFTKPVDLSKTEAIVIKTEMLNDRKH